MSRVLLVESSIVSGISCLANCGCDLASMVVFVLCALSRLLNCVCVDSTHYIFRCVHYSICVMKEVVGISKSRCFKCSLDVLNTFCLACTNVSHILNN